MATIENASIKSLLNYEISRANEVTKKADTTVHNAVGSLIDGYGQNVPNCEVLTEITLDSDVSVVSIDVTEEMKEKYEAFIIDFDLTFSKSDWLYFGSSKTPMQTYYPQAESLKRPNREIAFGIMVCKNKISEPFVTYTGIQSTGYFSDDRWDNLNALVLTMYTSGVTMKTGGTVTMRGVRKIYAN